MTNWVRKRHKDRCESKVAFRRASRADAAAQKMTHKHRRLFVSYECAGKLWVTPVRLKQKQFYVFCNGPHGSCKLIGDTATHPTMLDPVLIISTSVNSGK